MCNPGDRVRVTLCDGEVVTGTFDRYWDHADDDCGWVVKPDDSATEEWYETREMIKQEKINPNTTYEIVEQKNNINLKRGLLLLIILIIYIATTRCWF